MELQLVVNILSIIGTIAIGLPTILRVLEAIFAIIPGDEPDKALAKVREWSEKISNVVSKIYPSIPKNNWERISRK